MIPYVRPKRPTSTEWALAALILSALLIVMGVVALAVALRAPAERHDAAVILMYYGGWSLALGVLCAFGLWLIRRLTH